MTPALALILMNKRMDRMRLLEHPIAQVACIFWNANRDPGDSEKGRPAADAKPLKEFLVFKKSKKSLATKEEGPGGSHNLYGAKSDKSAWMGWAQGKQSNKPKVRV